jgi:hypothetical protein
MTAEPVGPSAAEGLTTEQILAGELPPEALPPAEGEDPLAGAGMWRPGGVAPPVTTGELARGVVDPVTGERVYPSDPRFEQTRQKIAGGVPGPPAAAPVRMGTTTVQTALQSDTSAQAAAMMGPRGAALVEQLRGQGVPEETIRQRLGLHTGPAPRPGVGMGMARPAAPKLPPELRALNPEPGFYLPGYREALEASDVPDEQKQQLRQQYETWLETDPRGVAAREQEQELEFGTKMAGFEQQRQAAEQRELEAQRELAAQQQEKAALQEAEFAQFRQDFEQSYQQADADYRAAVDELKATKVDPRRGAIPILDAFALALGAAGAAFTRGPNFAQQMIQSRIDNDIRAQLADISTLKDAAAAQHNRLGQLRARLGDERAAIETERALQLDQAKAYLTEKAAAAKSETAKVDAQRYLAVVDRELSRSQIRNEQRVRVGAAMAADQRLQQRRAAMGAAAQARRKRERVAEMQRTGLGPWQQKKATEMHRRYVPQAGGFVASEKQAGELATSLENSTRLRSLTGELLSIAEGGIGKKIDPKTVARAEALWSEAILISKEQDKLGVIAGPDMDLEAAKYRKPDKLFSMGAASGLRQNLQLINEAERSALRKTHVIPGEVGQFVDEKTGEPQYGYRLALPGRGQAPVAAPPIQEMPVAP